MKLQQVRDPEPQVYPTFHDYWNSTQNTLSTVALAAGMALGVPMVLGCGTHDLPEQPGRELPRKRGEPKAPEPPRKLGELMEPRPAQSEGAAPDPRPVPMPGAPPPTEAPKIRGVILPPRPPATEPPPEPRLDGRMKAPAPPSAKRPDPPTGPSPAP